MRSSFVAGMLCVGLSFVACKSRSFDSSETKNVISSGAENAPAMAFNALNIWRDGSGEPILDYPTDYGSKTPRNTNNVFYVRDSDLLIHEENHLAVVTAKVTEGATVNGNELSYPTSRAGKKLLLKFTEMKSFVSHIEAVEHCKQLGLRLPVLQELYDLCFAPGPEMSKRRCSNVWSATLKTEHPQAAWNIDPISDVTIHAWGRTDKGPSVRCVGAR
jgi:hypothetical protein